MNKKEWKDRAHAIWFRENNLPHSLIEVLHAIIDALPDEPTKVPHCAHWRCPDGVTYPYTPSGFVPVGAELVYGPEPVALKEYKGSEVCAKFDEDARKLRIMKAMEDIAEKQPDTTRFAIKDGKFWVVSALGWWPVNDMYSPEEPLKYAGIEHPPEPLWEGEIWVEGDKITDIGPPQREPGWRKIRVKEVR